MILGLLQNPAPPQHAAGGEAALVLPNLDQATFFGIGGRALLLWGLVICALGLLFGLAQYTQLRDLPVHRAMREISELIYETCKTYLLTQGRFLLILWVFIGAIVAVYFGTLAETVNAAGVTVHGFPASKVLIILLFSLIGIAGSYGVAWFGIRVNTFANSRTAFASLTGKPYPNHAIPLKAGMSIGMLLISVELLLMLLILLFNAGDSVGPSADGFETYGVTGVALISFILLAVHTPLVQVQLLVWIFAMRVMMIIASGASYFLNAAFTKARYQSADHMNFEAPLTTLVWLTSLVSVALTFVASRLLIPSIGGDATLWWKLSLVITCGTLAGAIIPELVKVFTSVHSADVREIVTSSREGGASLNILSGFVAGNFSAFWLGM